jgi:hypothetical protein
MHPGKEYGPFKPHIVILISKKSGNYGLQEIVFVVGTGKCRVEFPRSKDHLFRTGQG